MSQVIWNGPLHQTLVLILRGKPNNQELGNIVYKGATYEIYRDNGKVGFIAVASGVNDGAYGSSSFAGNLASGNVPVIEQEATPAPEEQVVAEEPPTPKKSTSKK